MGLLGQQIDDTNEVLFDTDRQHHHQRVSCQYFIDLIDHTVEVSAHTIHFVDEDDTGDLGFIGVAPVGLGLRFNTTGSTENTDTTVEHLQGAVHLDGEIHMSRGINDVHAVAFPLTGGGSGLNSNSPLGFLLHEVGGRLTIMHLTGLVDLTCQLQDALGGGRFTSIHVSEDTDVAVTGKICHVGSQIKINKIMYVLGDHPMSTPQRDLLFPDRHRPRNPPTHLHLRTGTEHEQELNLQPIDYNELLQETSDISPLE